MAGSGGTTAAEKAKLAAIQKQKIIAASATEKAQYLAQASAGGVAQESANGMLIPIQDNGGWPEVDPGVHPNLSTAQAMRRLREALGLEPQDGTHPEERLTLEEQLQRAAQEAAMNNAEEWISRYAQNPNTSQNARDVMESFRTGEGARLFTFEYEASSLNDLFEGFELFNSGPSGYFREEVNELINFGLAKYDRGYFQDGDIVRGFNYRDFGLQHDSILPQPRDLMSLRDGAADLGDVVGTMHSGWNLSVRSGNMYITGANLTSLEGYAAGNLAGRLGMPTVRNPTSGPFSTIRQEFTFVVPIPPHLRPPEPAPRRGQ